MSGETPEDSATGAHLGGGTAAMLACWINTAIWGEAVTADTHNINCLLSSCAASDLPHQPPPYAGRYLYRIMCPIAFLIACIA
jgi:hypothetical protein